MSLKIQFFEIFQIFPRFFPPPLKLPNSRFRSLKKTRRSSLAHHCREYLPGKGRGANMPSDYSDVYWWLLLLLYIDKYLFLTNEFYVTVEWRLNRSVKQEGCFDVITLRLWLIDLCNWILKYTKIYILYLLLWQIVWDVNLWIKECRKWNNLVCLPGLLI